MKGKQIKFQVLTLSDDEKQFQLHSQKQHRLFCQVFWTYPTPRHHVGDVMTGEVTMEEIVASDKIRVNPIGFGPYKVAKIVPGESVLYERNEDYWRGKPATKINCFESSKFSIQFLKHLKKVKSICKYSS